MIILIVLITATIFGESFSQLYQEPLSVCKSANDPCSFNVSQFNPNTEPKTVAEVIQKPCSESYDITLNDCQHSESVTVNKSEKVPILIKGINTTWVHTQNNDSIIFLFRGNLTLLNIQFNFTYNVSGFGYIHPAKSIIFANGTQLYSSLTINSCIFNGFGNNQTVFMIIYAFDVNQFIMKNCTFQNIIINNSISAIYGTTTKSEAMLMIDSCKFLNTNINSSQCHGVISIHLQGINQNITINGSTFHTCSNSKTSSFSGAIFLDSDSQSTFKNKFIVVGNKFINNVGYQTGAIYSTQVTSEHNYSNNEFKGNKKIGSNQVGCDAYIILSNSTSFQNVNQVINKTKSLFNQSTSTQISNVYFQAVINGKTNVSGNFDLDKGQEYCQSKSEQNEECKCDPYSTTYINATCQKDKLCITDLAHQNITNCPCQAAGDPRAGGICPGFCQKDQMTTNCTCDINSIANCPCQVAGDPRAGNECPEYCKSYALLTEECVCEIGSQVYPSITCQIEKTCKYDLANQNISYCPCQSTADPRAGKACPAYCVKGQINTSCVCDTGNSSFPLQNCQTEQICIVDIINQPNATCPCLATGDPRAGNGQCPAYCQRGSYNTDCICEQNNRYYPKETCEKEQLCLTDLINQKKTDCPCLSTGDPRAGNGECPQYCNSQSDITSDCICDIESTQYLYYTCLKDKECIFDLIHQNQSYCPCLPTNDPRAGKGQCQAYCVKGQVTADCACDSNITGYTVQQCQQEKLCITNLVNQTAANCPCLSTGDPRAGKGQCPAYCIGPDNPTSDCICDSNPNAYYPPQTCQSNKKCNVSSSSTVPTDSCTCTGTNYPSGCKCPTDSSQLTGIPKERCECLTTSDPRAGNGICPAYCVKDSLTENCVCDTGSYQYPSTTCQKDKSCKFNLENQNSSDCPCLPTGDPRAGNTCPYYCTAKDTPNSDCLCDSNSISYPPSTCQQEKQCIENSNSSVPTDSCTCTPSNYPYGCKCPTDSTQLYNIPKERCECRSTGDPRAGQICPAYCIKGQITQICICDSSSSSYSSTVCEIDKLCTYDLIHQSSLVCSCLMYNDPRAGGICPPYCISKYELTVECVCGLSSPSYPQATCERDKLCIVDLIHQSTTNCPCLEVDDPRGESVCKQTEIDPSDPDPTDPIIPDPSEQDPETEQEQGSGQKQDEVIEEQKEESSSSNIIWIIFLVIGIIAVIIVVITFFAFRSINKKKQIEKGKKNKEIQMELKERIIESENLNTINNTIQKPQNDIQSSQIIYQQPSIKDKIITSSSDATKLQSQQLSDSSNNNKNIQSQSSQKTQRSPKAPEFKVEILSLSSYQIKSNRRSSSQQQSQQQSLQSSLLQSKQSLKSQSTPSSQSSQSNDQHIPQSSSSQKGEISPLALSNTSLNSSYSKQSSECALTQQLLTDILEEKYNNEEQNEQLEIKDIDQHENEFKDQEKKKSKQKKNRNEIKKQKIEKNQTNKRKKTDIEHHKHEQRSHKGKTLFKSKTRSKKVDDDEDDNSNEIEEDNENENTKSHTKQDIKKSKQKNKQIQKKKNMNDNSDSTSDSSSSSQTSSAKSSSSQTSSQISSTQQSSSQQSSLSSSSSSNQSSQSSSQQSSQQSSKSSQSQLSYYTQSSILYSSQFSPSISFSKPTSTNHHTFNSTPDSPICSPVPLDHSNIAYSQHQSLKSKSDRSFQTASESNRGCLDHSRSESVSSNALQRSKSGEMKDFDSKSEMSEVSNISKLSKWKLYNQQIPPEEKSQRSQESNNTGVRKEDSTPITQNSNSSDESKNKQKQEYENEAELSLFEQKKEVFN